MKSTLFLLAILFGFFAFTLVSCKSGGATTSSTPKVKKEVPPALDMLDLLRREPFLYITGSGANARIQLRGQKTISDPDEEVMFLLDGQRLGIGYQVVQDINPNDVEGIEVIRDQARLARYNISSMTGAVNIRIKKQ
ncbi:MAG: TonB-dependent receptor plug domain-containing protein [Bacteroidia bacterium]|nr:TonB-dependent receptor plug domain-containing protein [Bacteroidia bacterium]